ncbi:3,4-dihydroxy-2-butanone-4-phosphate synthase [Kribbella turkmenica]|uniref:3,4-dihydroxy-2-butanone 4-phosphate synthase n=1 Tax=Kribbella turkmenica TaxID=2530375 RepID=A0A4R4WTL7_9ACTN|nr:3,4-dihydroxy-2-butanone-4-phosphate synthase [Kribbella turkmenica]TDD21003.1 3,4-dihydroxy-2-butanone-4-phosphate synthase [Kribbella turkmenica]
MSSATTTRLDTIQRAIGEIARGRPVVVVDDEDRENEGDLTFAASLATPELMALLVRHTSGYVCAPSAPEILDRLRLPLMVPDNQDSLRTAYTVSVDASTGVGTGISAADRARTVRVLADPAARPTDLIRPGHILPLRAVEGGVRQRPGHTEATVELVRLAGLPPVGVIGELMNDDGTLMTGPGLRTFADAHGLAMVSIADLVSYLS